MTKTVQEIQESFSEEASSLIRDWYKTEDGIRNSHVGVDVPRGVTVTAPQKRQAIAAQKEAIAAEEARGYREKYAKLAQDANEQIQARASRLARENFWVEDSGTLARAFGYPDEKLAEAVRTAAKTGNADFAKAAFAVAEECGVEYAVAATSRRTRTHAPRTKR